MRIDRQKVYEKYDKHCAYCGILLTEQQMQVDHIQPIIMGGGNDFENLNPSCRYCNNYKSHSSLETFRHYLYQMLNVKLNYLFRSKTKMQVALNFGVVELSQWDGKFYFERSKK